MDWDSLFEKASDIGASVEVSQGPKDAKSSRKRKRKRKIRQNDDASQAYSRMLQSRMDLPPNEDTSWNSWMVIKDSLYSNDVCSQWRASSSTHSSKCETCGETRLYHRLTVSNKESWSRAQTWHLFAFVHIRNIRCCAKKVVVKPKNNPRIKKSLQTIRSEASKLKSLSSIVYGQIEYEEASLLQSKIKGVIDKVTGLWSDYASPADICKIIQLIIACDAVYYRIYYLQLIKMTPMLTDQDGAVFLPHPQIYFGLPFLTMDIPFESSNMDSRLIQDAKDVAQQNSDLWFLLNHLKLVGDTRKDEHPLLSIHRLRSWETATIFSASKWASPSYIEMLAPESIKNEEKDETPAPQILMEWRDSCRDFMCNLYAYATLSQEVLQKFSTVFHEVTHCKSMVEIGAGTGYIAKLFTDAGIPVDAWDVCPTDNQSKSMNEYHGHVPSFHSVREASTFPLVNSTNIALLLCYPPPQSKMAYNTLKGYMRTGGKYLVHIGEFKGLTGDASFENLLLKSMLCKARFPCMGWGTDASFLTIWQRVDEKISRNMMLLPCSNCNKCEATKRFRLVRNIVYCSKKCCNDHKNVREQQLKMAMVEADVDEDWLAFESLKGFSPLT